MPFWSKPKPELRKPSFIEKLLSGPGASKEEKQAEDEKFDAFSRSCDDPELAVGEEEAYEKGEK